MKFHVLGTCMLAHINSKYDINPGDIIIIIPKGLINIRGNNPISEIMVSSSLARKDSK